MQSLSILEFSNSRKTLQEKFHFPSTISIMRITLLFGSLAMALIMLPLMAQRNDVYNFLTIVKSQNYWQNDSSRTVMNGNYSRSPLPQIATPSTSR